MENWSSTAKLGSLFQNDKVKSDKTHAVNLVFWISPTVDIEEKQI